MTEIISHRQISFSKSNLSEIIGEFRGLRKEIIDAPDKEKIALSEYLEWRGKLIPFLASTPQDGRNLLYSYPFILAFIQPKNQNTREICKRVIINIIDHEFTERLKEIGEAGEETLK
jgi:hypothetical protein